MQTTSCKMPGWMKNKLKPRLPGKISTIRYAGDITLMAENEEELNSLLMSVKEESEKAGLKLNIQKTKIMASGSHQFTANRRAVDGDCSHEIKRCLLLGRKPLTNLDSMLKSRDITLLTKVHIVTAMVVFLVVMYGCKD